MGVSFMVVEKSKPKKTKKTKKDSEDNAEIKKEKTEKEIKKEEVPKSETPQAQKPVNAKKPTRQKRKSGNSTVARGKRKKAIARASITSGKGSVRINKMSVSGINNSYIRELILEPVKLAGDKSAKVDIRVSVFGGGTLGQAQACRTAIARALVEHFEDESLKSSYLERDRSLLVEDSRRTESKKYKGPKARARYQKSYR